MADDNSELTDTPRKDTINILKKLVSYDEIEKISIKSDWEGAKQTAFHTGCLLFSGILVKIGLHWSSMPGSPFSVVLSQIFYWMATILHAFFLSFLFMPLHEATHYTAFESLWANKTLAWVTGFLTGRAPMYYLVYHFPHHRFTGDPKRDPELQDSLIDLKMTSLLNYVIYITGFPFWLDRIITTARLCQGTVTEPWVIEQKKSLIVWEARYLTVLYSLVAIQQIWTGSTFAWYYWVLPSFLAQPFLRFYLISEHTGCKLSANMMENTRTTVTDWFYSKLAWHMPWHAEHHAFPKVPFHALAKAHELCKKASIAKTGCTPPGKNGYIEVNMGIISGLIQKKTN